MNKSLQENYNGEDTLHSNRRRSESNTALEEEEDILTETANTLDKVSHFAAIYFLKERSECK